MNVSLMLLGSAVGGQCGGETAAVGQGEDTLHNTCTVSGSAVGGQCGGETAAIGQGEDPLHNTGNTAHEQLLRVC